MTTDIQGAALLAAGPRIQGDALLAEGIQAVELLAADIQCAALLVAWVLHGWQQVSKMKHYW